MKIRGILLPILALALAQVPWIPCHCGEGCEIRPLLVATTHRCDDPEHEVIHRTCPAHGCTGHKDAQPPRTPHPEGDHDHEIFILQAVSSPPAPSLPLGTSMAWTEAVDGPSTAARVPTDGAHVYAGEATGPPRALATIRLLV